jgi:pimeloyl-ACP methyl ester carboxylesterase
VSPVPTATYSARRLPHISPAVLARLRWLFRVLQAVSTRLAARVMFTLFLRPNRRRLNAEDAPLVAQARVHRVVSGKDVVQIHEWRAGDQAGAGQRAAADERTVLIIHGWGSHAPRFAPMACALAARGWRVLAIDAPAHGTSPGRSSSLPQFIEALDAAGAKLGPVQALVGHSLGALAVMLRMGRGVSPPQHLVRKLVLISMPSGAPYLVSAFEVMLGIRQRTAERFRTLFDARFAARPEHFVAADVATRISVPVLLVHDRQDDIIPCAHSEALLPLLRQGQLHTTAGLGHSGLVREAATIEAIADFLDRD